MYSICFQEVRSTVPRSNMEAGQNVCWITDDRIIILIGNKRESHVRPRRYQLPRIEPVTRVWNRWAASISRCRGRHVDSDNSAFSQAQHTLFVLTRSNNMSDAKCPTVGLMTRACTIFYSIHVHDL